MVYHGNSADGVSFVYSLRALRRRVGGIITANQKNAAPEL